MSRTYLLVGLAVTAVVVGVPIATILLTWRRK